MRAIFLSLSLWLFFFSSVAALGDSSHPRHNLCKSYLAAENDQGAPAPDRSAEGFHFISECSRGNRWQRVEGNAQMKKFLSGLSKTVGQVLPVYSCFRTQQSQNYTLCLNECASNNLRLAPNFGTVQCSGRIAATQSEHTYGVAADFFVNASVPPGSSKSAQIQEIRRFCHVLNDARKAYGNGWGGITVYGLDKGKSFMHYDVKRDWCNWSVQCEAELGEGNCKRKKFNDNVIRLEQKLADAKLGGSQAAVAKLETVLKKLKADCKPGDLSCRDYYKNPEL